MLLLPNTEEHHLKPHLQISLPSSLPARGGGRMAQGSSFLHQPSISSEAPSLNNAFTHKNPC